MEGDDSEQLIFSWSNCGVSFVDGFRTGTFEGVEIATFEIIRISIVRMSDWSSSVLVLKPVTRRFAGTFPLNTCDPQESLLSLWNPQLGASSQIILESLSAPTLLIVSLDARTYYPLLSNSSRTPRRFTRPLPLIRRSRLSSWRLGLRVWSTSQSDGAASMTWRATSEWTSELLHIMFIFSAISSWRQTRLGWVNGFMYLFSATKEDLRFRSYFAEYHLNRDLCLSLLSDHDLSMKYCLF
jgi:hypothetical protein